MNRLVFYKPEAFAWFLVLIPFFILMFLHYKRRFPYILKLIYTEKASGAGANGGMSGKTLISNLKARYIYSSFFFLLFISALICALADPRMGLRVVREFRRGADVVLAFDISRSMTISDVESGDIPPKNISRLHRAVELARGFIEAGGDLSFMRKYNSEGGSVILRYGIAIGKGEGVLALPVSADAEASLAFLDALSSSIMSAPGTNLEKLLLAAGGGFSESSPAGKNVVLFSDGEALKGSAQSAAEKLKRDDITLIAVGIGSEYGALISESEEAPVSASRAKKDETLVRSYRHSYVLERAAERSGGCYIDGNSASALYALAEKIFPQALSSSQVTREEPDAVWYVFVMAALVFLAFSNLLRFKWKGSGAAR